MRILVVEDNHDCAESLKCGLLYEGYAVDVAYSGEKAEMLADDVHYDCILLDLILPGKDGLAVCQSLRQKKNMTPVLIVTGECNRIEDIVKGLDSGADDYLIKPFDYRELCARVRSILRRACDIKEVKIEVGNIVIDTATNRVWKGPEEEIELTPKEHSILDYLARYADSNVNRTILEQHVWDLQNSIGSNVLEAHIKNLRAKLDPENKGLIQTIRGVGYRLNTKNGSLTPSIN